MVLSEEEFHNTIVCKFPYNNENKWKQVIDQALTISNNAVFLVAYELVYLPTSKKKYAKEAKRILHYLAQKFDHPLKEKVFRVGEMMLEEKELPVNDAIKIMREIAKYPPLAAALSIIYFSCNDIDGDADELYNQIILDWNRKTGQKEI